jgi:hypothetical protein
MERKLGLNPLTMDELREQVNSKLCPSFLQLRKNRLMLGYARYEMYGKNKAYDSIGSAIARLEAYRQTGNRELLVDASNLVEIEWCRPLNEGTYFESEDDALHVTET